MDPELYLLNISTHDPCEPQKIQSMPAQTVEKNFDSSTRNFQQSVQDEAKKTNRRRKDKTSLRRSLSKNSWGGLDVNVLADDEKDSPVRTEYKNDKLVKSAATDIAVTTTVSRRAHRMSKTATRKRQRNSNNSWANLTIGSYDERSEQPAAQECSNCEYSISDLDSSTDKSSEGSDQELGTNRAGEETVQFQRESPLNGYVRALKVPVWLDFNLDDLSDSDSDSESEYSSTDDEDQGLCSGKEDEMSCTHGGSLEGTLQSPLQILLSDLSLDEQVKEPTRGKAASSDFDTLNELSQHYSSDEGDRKLCTYAKGARPRKWAESVLKNSDETGQWEDSSQKNRQTNSVLVEEDVSSTKKFRISVTVSAEIEQDARIRAAEMIIDGIETQEQHRLENLERIRDRLESVRQRRNQSRR